MGRKERNRYEVNEKIIELLSDNREWTEQERLMALDYSGYGGLNGSGSAKGQFFTPNEVVQFVIDMLKIKQGDKVCEPSCGNGRFLYHLPAGVESIGIEFDHEVARVAQKVNPQSSVICGDGLEFLSKQKEQFDYIVGNPPYSSDILAKSRFSNKSGKVDPVLAFIERSMDSLKEGGLLAMVVPESILGNKRSASFRSWLIKNYIIRASITLPNETFYFSGTSVATAVLVVQKKKTGVDYGDYQIFMAIVDNIGWNSRGIRNNLSDLPLILSKWNDYVDSYMPVISSQQEEIPFEVIKFKAKRNSEEIEQLAIAL